MKKKTRNSSKPSERHTQSGGKVVKRLLVDWNNSCKDENSSWDLNGLYSPIMSVE